MKKTSLFLLAGGLIALASCNNEAQTGMTQAQQDSAVNAIVDQRMMEMNASNDSMINAMAQWKADSMMAANSGRPIPTAPISRTPRPTTSTPSTPATPATTAPTKQDQKFDQRQNGSNTISDEKKKEQDDKFKNRGGN